MTCDLFYLRHPTAEALIRTAQSYLDQLEWRTHDLFSQRPSGLQCLHGLFFADRKIIALKESSVFITIFMCILFLQHWKNNSREELQCLMLKWINETVFLFKFHIILKDNVGLKLLSPLHQVHFRASTVQSSQKLHDQELFLFHPSSLTNHWQTVL